MRRKRQSRLNLELGAGSTEIGKCGDDKRGNGFISSGVHYLRFTHYALRITFHALLLSIMGWYLASASALDAEEITLTLLHTNDTYGQLQSLPTETGEEIGGVLRRAALIRQIMQAAPLSLLLDAGDALGPHPLVRFDQGYTAIDMMHQMGYTAMAVGNHELTDGVEVLQGRMAGAPFPMLCANLRLKAGDKPLTPRFIIRQVGEIRVGLFGVISPTIRTRILARLLQPLVVLDPIQTAQQVVAELQRSECDLIIALTHLGYDADLDLIGQVKGIHLIIGSEVELPDDRTIGAMFPVEGVGATTLVYCPWRGTHLGRVDVRFIRRPRGTRGSEQSDGSLRLHGMETRQYRLDEATISQAHARQALPEIAAQLDGLIQRYQASQVGVIGQVQQGEQISTLDLIPWILREHTKAEIALLNRGSLAPILLEGKVQKQQIMESIRFANYVTLLELTGAQLKAALAYSAEQAAPSRTLLLVGVDAKGQTVNGRPIHEAEVYSVATNDFLAAGGDNYQMLKAARHTRETGVPLSQAVVEFSQMTAQTGEPFSASRIQQARPRSVWKSKGEIEVTLQGSDISDSAARYPQISELKHKNTGTFAIGGARFHLSTVRAAPRHSLELRMDSQYRRFRHPKAPTLELADSTKAAAIFRYASSQTRFVPLLRFEVEDIEFTPEQDSRIVALLGSGLESNVAPDVKLSTGVVGRRNFRIRRAEDPNLVAKEPTIRLDLDLRAQVQRQIHEIRLQSSLEWFPTVAAKGERPLSRSIVRWQSSATLPLRKGLSLNAKFFLYRDARLGPSASAATLAVQWGATWGKKP